MQLTETGLLAARDLDEMDQLERVRWEHLALVLPGVRKSDYRPEHLSMVDWDTALALTVRLGCTEDEIKEYFMALNPYYPLDEFRELYEHITGHIPSHGPEK